MPVTSRDLDALMADLPPMPAARTMPKAATSAPRSPTPPRAYGAIGIMLGLIFWPIGAWYTAAGWAQLANWALTFFGLPALVPAPAGIPGVVAALVIGLLYSSVEFSPPLGRHTWRSAVMLWALWGVVILSDVYTTYAGMASPGIAAGVVAALLTFAPDQATIRGARILRGRSPF
jgi:hypothetical protein